MAKKEEVQVDVKEAKLKALQAAMTKIEKDFGKGSIMKLGDRKTENVEVIPTGSLSLNQALGVGGYPRGRIIEIFGPESSGKTTLAIHAIAEAQRMGGIAAYIDAEHAFDPVYAEKLGVNVDDLLILPTSLSAAQPWTSWWWTRWPPLRQRQRLRETWARTRWACRLD